MQNVDPVRFIILRKISNALKIHAACLIDRKKKGSLLHFKRLKDENYWTHWTLDKIVWS